MDKMCNMAMDMFISNIQQVNHPFALEVIELAKTFKGFESSIWLPFIMLLIMIDTNAEAFKIISNHVSKMCGEVLEAEAMNVLGIKRG